LERSYSPIGARKECRAKFDEGEYWNYHVDELLKWRKLVDLVRGEVVAQGCEQEEVNAK